MWKLSAAFSVTGSTDVNGKSYKLFPWVSLVNNSIVSEPAYTCPEKMEVVLM